MNKKRCKALLGLVQLLPAVAAAAAVLFALPRTVPVLAAVPDRLAAVVEQPAEAASSEAEEEVLPKQEIAEVEAYNASVLQAQSAAQAEQSQSGYRDGTYEGSAFGFGDVIRVSVTIQNGKMTDIAVLDASGEDKPYYKQALPLLDEMLAVQSAGVDTVSGATITAEGLVGAVEDALGKAAG